MGTYILVLFEEPYCQMPCNDLYLNYDFFVFFPKPDSFKEKPSRFVQTSSPFLTVPAIIAAAALAL